MKPATKPLTAIFGGSFDPPHVGHEEAILDLLERAESSELLPFQRVVILLTPQSPLKPKRSRAENRLIWLKKAWGHFAPRIVIDTLELDRAQAHPETPIRTIDSIPELKKKYGELAFVIGTDQLIDLPRWFRFSELIGQCEWVILARKGTDLSAAQQVARQIEDSGHLKGRKFHWVETRARALSSTQIREDAAKTGKIDPLNLPSALRSEIEALPKLW
jgi:nicotinate-nucleotide adenylyltransferase